MSISRGAINIYSTSIDAGMTSASIWEDSSQIYHRLFKKFVQNGPRNVDTEVELKFIDLPIYHIVGHPETLKFFKALKETENLKLFELNSIKFMIEYHWPITKEYTKLKLLYPFIAYLFLFWINNNFL